MEAERIEFALAGAGKVSGLRTRGEGAGRGLVFVYAPGAGSNLGDPFGAYAARALAGAGVDMVRFQFPYMEARRSAPDRPALLEATWRSVLEALRPEGASLVAGGRSMGGRIGSQVVAAGEAVAALALFAYPLHPPGRPEQARDAHLRQLGVPALFCSGTRDAFGTPDELAAAAALVEGAHLHLLEGADHGFSVLKSSGRTREDVWREATTALLALIESLPGSRLAQRRERPRGVGGFA